MEKRLTPRNIVATVNLECRLDLKTIALHARNAEYNPKVSLRPLSTGTSIFLFLFLFLSINGVEGGLEMRDGVCLQAEGFDMDGL